MPADKHSVHELDLNLIICSQKQESMILKLVLSQRYELE